jgi:integrating conjugative element protein (TIGR03757 family)
MIFSIGLKRSLLAWLGLISFVLPVYLSNSTAVYAEPITVLAFTDNRRFPICHADSSEVKVTVYDLAAPQRAMAQLNAQIQLPANPALATALAKDYLQTHQAELAQRLLPTYEGLSKALNLGISHYPALVFNNLAVIVGVTDIQQGLAIYQNWQQEQAHP